VPFSYAYRRSLVSHLSDKYFDPEQPLHETRKFRHDACSIGKNKALAVTRTETGWLYICHRCGIKGMKRLKGLSPSDTVRFITSQKALPRVVDDEVVLLPDDYTTSIPDNGLVYLYNYLTDKEIEYYRVVYSNSLNRVIFPVYDGNSLVTWQGRYLGEPDPKIPKWFNQRTKSKKHNYFKVKRGSNTLVIVEDILSAIRVGRVVDCYAVLGSYIPDELIKEISRVYSEFRIWLDYDKLKASLRYQKKFQMLGLKCKVISTLLDPKCYGTKEIERRVYGQV